MCDRTARYRGWPWRLHALVVAVSLVATVIAGCGHPDSNSDTPKTMSERDYADSVRDKAQSACANVANAAPPSSQGTISGPSVEMQGTSSTNGTLYAPYWGLGIKFATSDSTFKSLVCILETKVQVSTYVDESGHTLPADRRDWVVRVLSWPSGDIIADHEFQGDDPSQNCTSYGGSTEFCQGAQPANEPFAWIKTVIVG